MFRPDPVGGGVAITRNMGWVRRAARLAAVLWLLVPAAASAVTVEQIVALSKAGVSEEVILGLLDRDRTILSIDPERLAALKREGLSDKLLLAMLRSGREQGDATARAEASAKAADILASLASPLQPDPHVVIVGHGPDRPNTVAASDEVDRTIRRGPIIPPFVPYGSPFLPYGSPFHRGGSRLQGARKYDGAAFAYRGDRLLCLAQVNTAKGPGPAFITECPAIMQPPLRLR
jgi:hypothetical protein